MSYSSETNSSMIANIIERWQKMTITSDPMFGMVMENKKICLELIWRALPWLKVNELFTLLLRKIPTCSPEEKPIKSFLDLMRKQVDNNDRFITQIQSEITQVKQDPERRAGFMKFELDLMDAKREAHEKGLEEGLKEGQSVANNKAIKEFVINFKELGLDNQDIKQRLMRSFNLAAEQATQAVQNK